MGGPMARERRTDPRYRWMMYRRDEFLRDIYPAESAISSTSVIGTSVEPNGAFGSPRLGGPMLNGIALGKPEIKQHMSVTQEPIPRSGADE
jgi:hypothetical protein